MPGTAGHGAHDQTDGGHRMTRRAEHAPPATRLIAYVLPNRGSTVDAAEWQRFVAQQLPAWMIPSVFVPVESLPRTPGGKADRQSLASRRNDRNRPTAKIASPRTQTETLLTSIWRDVLGIDEPAVDEDFFELGGHSLSAARIIARVRAAVGIEIPLQQIFEAPTISELALAIDRLAGPR